MIKQKQTAKEKEVVINELIVIGGSQNFRVKLWNYGAFILLDDKEKPIIHFSRTDLDALKIIVDLALVKKQEFLGEKQ